MTVPAFAVLRKPALPAPNPVCVVANVQDSLPAAVVALIADARCVPPDLKSRSPGALTVSVGTARIGTG
jgi:hypothetical protein